MNVRSALWAGIGLTISCSPHRVTQNPKPPIEVPAAFRAATQGAPMEKWWVGFNDPELSRLVDLALKDNFQIRGAWARLDQAAALLTQTKSASWPQLQASFQASRSQSRSPFAGVAGTEMFPTIFTLDQFNLSLAASYEVDVWNKAGSQGKAAMLDGLALRDDLESMAMTLTSQVAETWYQRVTQLAMMNVLTEQAKLSNTLLELAKFRFKQGLGSAAEVYQQEQQLVALQSQLPLVEARLGVLSNQLAVLVGQVPSQFKAKPQSKLPSLPALPATGVPADLLERRPDVRAARKRAEAADYRVASAVSARLPSLTLSGSAGFQENKLPNLLDSFVWNIAGGLLAPLFNAGRLRAEVDRNKAKVDEGLAHYGQTLLTAMAEVENALIQEKQQSKYIELLKRQKQVGDSALREARARYQNGVGDQGYLAVLTALLNVQKNEIDLVKATRERLSYRIQLCRSLGGSWSMGLTKQDAKGNEQ